MKNPVLFSETGDMKINRDQRKRITDLFDSCPLGIKVWDRRLPSDFEFYPPFVVAAIPPYQGFRSHATSFKISSLGEYFLYELTTSQPRPESMPEIPPVRLIKLPPLFQYAIISEPPGYTYSYILYTQGQTLRLGIRENNPRPKRDSYFSLEIPPDKLVDALGNPVFDLQ